MGERYQPFQTTMPLYPPEPPKEQKPPVKATIHLPAWYDEEPPELEDVKNAKQERDEALSNYQQTFKEFIQENPHQTGRVPWQELKAHADLEKEIVGPSLKILQAKRERLQQLRILYDRANPDEPVKYDGT